MGPAPTRTRHPHRNQPAGPARPTRSAGPNRAALAAGPLTATLLLTGCLGDGMSAVGGGGIDTGVYQSVEARPGQICSYARRASNGDLLGSGFSSRGHGVQYVELMFADRAFTTQGCEVWIPASTLGPSLAPGQDIPQGMFRVGVDVRPGVHSTSGNPICSWSRLRNARHEEGSAIASGSVDGLVGFVTIQADDAYFETRGCEPWGRVN
jgi:hypothetical protein